MKFFDVHAHVYPDRVAQRAKQSIEQFYHHPVQMDGRVETLLVQGQQAGITRHVIHSVGISWERVAAINTFIAATVAAHPDRFVGFGTMVPSHPHLGKALEDMMALGLRGVKLHPDIQHYDVDSDEAMGMLDAIADRGLPVLLHVGDDRYDFSHPEKVAYVLDRIPHLTVICAHLGGWTMWREGWRYLAGRDNVYADCSSSLFALQPREAVRIFQHFGMDHVIFGTDYPMWSPTEEVERFLRLPLTREEQQLIDCGNLERLLKVSA